MARFYAATGDAIARLDEADGAWRTTLSLTGSGTQCLALDLADPDTVYAVVRAKAGFGEPATRAPPGSTGSCRPRGYSRWRSARPPAPSTQAPSRAPFTE